MFGFDLPPVQLGLGDTRCEVELYDIALETAWYNSGASPYEADR